MIPYEQLAAALERRNLGADTASAPAHLHDATEAGQLEDATATSGGLEATDYEVGEILSDEELPS